MEKRYIQFFNYLNLIAALCLTAVFPLYYVKQRWAVIFFFVSYLIDFIVCKRWRYIRKDNTKWLYYAFIIFFLLIPFYHLFEESNMYYAKAIEVYLPFLAFGVIGLFGYNKLFCFRYFAIVTVITSFFLICLMIGDIGLKNFLQAADKSLIIAEERIKLINNHMIFNTYLNISLISVFYLIFSGDRKILPRYGKIGFTLMGIVIFSILFLSEGRTGFITSIAIVVIFLSYYIWNWKKFISIFVTVLLTVLSVYIIIGHSKIKNVENIENEERFYIWEVGIETALQKPLIGYGISDAREKFYENGIKNEEYMQLGWYNYAFGEKKTHPHNQYLQSIMSFGLLGISLLLFVFIFPFFVCPAKKRIYIFLFLSIFVIQSFFEIFGVGMSVLIYTFFTTIFFQKNIHEKITQRSVNK